MHVSQNWLQFLPNIGQSASHINHVYHECSKHIIIHILHNISY